ncbi:hypothetical protein B566_EDAN006435 [Ephemera danica]|nr:hypothetical protein B566_EDAN006435 [Ephemera danica]
MAGLTQRVQLNQERAFMVAGIVLFSLMGSFVLWGPSQKKKRIKNSTGVNGLVNMGETCFLNTLLQAIASSPYFCEWLTKHQESDIAQALLKVVQYVNGRNAADMDIPFFPRSVVSAMSKNGWSIGSGQQDSHELFFALMTCLEEQTTQPLKPQDILNELGNENSLQILYSPQSPELKNKSEETTDSPPLTSDPEISLTDDVNQNEKLQPNGCKPGNRCSFVCRTGRDFNGLKMRQRRTDFPFRGQQLSQLSCTVCSSSSTVQHQAFDCLSLTLPEQGIATLQQLLSSFTAPEQVQEVLCEHCTTEAGHPVKTTFVKQLSIGRLPKCLCVHIQRTFWLNNGQSYKRHDFVSFPEVLTMDQFTYCYKERLRRAFLQQLKPKNKIVKNEVKENTSDECATSEPSEDISNPQNSKTATKEPHTDIKYRLVPKHQYKLQAVVVHLGEENSGHFITYRRPPPPYASTGKWIYVSDEQCYATNLADVLCVCAYMLFYEKI